MSVGRRQPPVSSPIGAGALVAAAVAAGRATTARGLVAEIESLRSILARRFNAPAVALTDSGTSALVLAFAITLPRGGTVALPAYGCVDLVAAARYGGLRVRLYDVDPATLSPDLDSLRHTLGRGVDVVVIAHFYGFAADVEGARAVASAAGVPVIEDAAQHAGGQLAGRPLGAFGPLTVLSFGRGKGTTGGRGGALLATADAGGSIVSAVTAVGASPWGVPGGVGDLTRAAAQWLLGRPSLYSLPASIPGLRLGETIYHPAHEPESLSRAAAVLVARAFDTLDADREVRARRANDLIVRLEAIPGLQLVRPIRGSVSGFLRLPVLDRADRAPATALGIVRSYPRSLAEEPAIAAAIHEGEPDMPGAREVCGTLFTLPTHRFVADADADRIAAWAAGAAYPRE